MDLGLTTFEWMAMAAFAYCGIDLLQDFLGIITHTHRKENSNG